MVSKNMERIQITLSKKQNDWLENLCKSSGITKSKYISWCLVKSAKELLQVLKLNTHFGNYTDEEISEICKAKWIDEND